MAMQGIKTAILLNINYAHKLNQDRLLQFKNEGTLLIPVFSKHIYLMQFTNI